MVTVEVIAENEVTMENLTALFKRAFFSTSLDEDGDLLVKTGGPRVYVTVDEDHKLLRYTATYGVKETAPLELKHALVNKMNDEVIFCRFLIPKSRPDMLVVEYSIPFEEGIPAFQIVSALRLFANVISFAIRTCDDNDLVE